MLKSILNENNLETIVYADDATLIFTDINAQELIHKLYPQEIKCSNILPSTLPALTSSKPTQINFIRIHEQKPEFPDV